MKNYRSSSIVASSVEGGTIRQRQIEYLKSTALAALVATGVFTFTTSEVSAQQYWDGAAADVLTVEGGDGTWTNDPLVLNWTNATGLLNAPYNLLPATDTVFGDSATAVTPDTAVGGTVTVDNTVSQVVLTDNVDFAATSDDTIFRIVGDELQLSPNDTIFDVADVRNSFGPDAVVNSAILANGAAGLEKAGVGILRFGGANTYTGVTTISDGRLRVSNDDALGTTDEGTVVGIDGALELASGVTIVGETLELSGAGTSNIGALRSIGSAGATEFGGAITLNTDSKFRANANSTLTISGTVTGAGTDLVVDGFSTTIISNVIDLGTGGLTKEDSGTLTLTADNLYSGTTTVDEGTLEITGVGAIDSTVVSVNGGELETDGGAFNGGNAGANVTVAPGATLDLNGDEEIASLAGGGAVDLQMSRLTVSGDTNTEFAGVITGNRGAVVGFQLLRAGTGTLTLSGDSTYTGPTVALGGTLDITGSIDSITVRGGVAGVINVSNGDALVDTAAVILVGTSNLTLVNDDETIGSLTGAGGVTTTLTGGSLTTGGDDTDTAFAGEISGAGGINKAGTGTFTLSDTNTYSGATNVNGGTLAVSGSIASAVVNVNNNGILQVDGASIADTSALTLNDTGNLTLSPMGVGETIGSLAGAAGTTISLNANTLTVGDANDTEFAGIASGAGGLTKQGGGTLTLTNANDYTGDTDVNAGVLELGSTANTNAAGSDTVATIAGAVNVNSGGTFRGTGTTGDLVVNSGGTAAPGLSPGTLTVANFTANAGSTTEFELNTPGQVGGGDPITGNDLIIVQAGGTATINPAATFDFANAVEPDGLYRLINTDAAGSVQTSGGGAFTTVSTAGAAPVRVYTTGNGQFLNAAIGVTTEQYWNGADQAGDLDGTPDGGAGTWNAANTNWTTATGTLNDSWQGTVAPPVTGIFQTAGGAVTVAGIQGFGGLRFDVGGYTLSGGTLQANDTDDSSEIDATAGTTTIASIISGIVPATGITKLGAGTVIFTGDNTYTGDTIVNGGVLDLGGGTATGSIDSATVTIAGGTLLVNNTAGDAVLDTAQLGLTGAGSVLDVDESETIGSVDGDTDAAMSLAAGAVLTTGDNAGNNSFEGVISGDGGLTKQGTDTFTLSANNTYTGVTTVNNGVLQIGAGGTTGTIGDDSDAAIAAPGELHIDRSNTYTYGGTISGNGELLQEGAGETILTADSSGFTGTTNVDNGILQVDGQLGGTVDVGTNGTAGRLEGTGTVSTAGLTTTIGADGTLAAGNSPGTLNIAGNLVLNGASTSEFEFGTPNVISGPTNDLVTVGGNLTVAGTLNLGLPNTFAPGPATPVVSGFYNLFDVAGTTTGSYATVNNGLDDVTAETTQIITNGGAASSEFNILLNLGGQVVQFWDGPEQNNDATDIAPNGGNGTWNAANSNWTTVNGQINSNWQSQVGVFGNAAGNNVIINGAQDFQGLQFTTNGYVLNGPGTLNATGDAFGNTTASFFNTDGGVTATVNAVISGDPGIGIDKLGNGTLILGGANTYTGATTVAAGTLQIAASERIADGSDLVVNGGTFDLNNFTETVANLSGAGGAIDTGGTAGGLTVNQSANGTYAGNWVGATSILGSSPLTKNGAGTLTLTGTNTQTGDGLVTINAGVLEVQNGNAIGDSQIVSGGGGTFRLLSDETIGLLNHSGPVELNANTLTLLGSAPNTVTGIQTGAVSGTGGVTVNIGDDTQRFTAVNTYTGPTTVISGLLDNDGTIASATNVVNGGEYQNDGTVSGTVQVNNTGLFDNNAIVDGALSVAAGGTATNSGNLNAGVTNASNAGGAGFTNEAGGAVTGGLTNTGLSTNAVGGMIDSLTNNGGTTTNNGAISGTALITDGLLDNNSGATVGGTTTLNGAAANVDNAGTLANVTVTDGRFDNENGGQAGAVANSDITNNNVGGTIASLTNNAGTTTNNGAISGTALITDGLLDNNSGATVGGTTTLNGAAANVDNAGTLANVTVTDGRFDNENGGQAGTVRNSDITNNNVGGTISSVINSGTIVNNGAVTNNLGNTGTATNNGTAGSASNSNIFTNNNIIAGIVTNTGGTFDNNAGGTIGGLATVSGGVFNNNGGTLNGGFDNSAIFNSTNGTLNGPVDNMAGGVFNQVGATLGNGTFDNNGTFNTAGVNSIGGPGAGFTAFNNNGLLNSMGALTINAATSSNSGTIDLGANNVLGDTVNFSGNLNATGTFNLDIDLSRNNAGGQQLSDRINVGSLSGSGAVINFDQLGAIAVLQDNPIIVIDSAGGNSTGNSFRATGLPPASGTILHQLVRLGNDYAVVSQVNPAAGGIAGNITLVQSLIGSVVNRPTSPFVSGVVGADEPVCGPGTFLRGTGGNGKASGDTFNQISRQNTEIDVKYTGVQFAIDFGCYNTESGYDVSVGTFGGYNSGSTIQDVFLGVSTVRSSVTFADFTQGYFGGYVTVAKDSFSADLQARYGRTDFTFNNPSLGLVDSKLDSDRFTLSGSATYSKYLTGAFESVSLRPFAGFALSHTESDVLKFAGNLELAPEDFFTAIGFAGITIARDFVAESGTEAYQPFFTATIYNDFGDDPNAIFTDGNSGVSQVIESENLGAFAEFSAGFNYVKILDESKLKQLTTSFRADYKIGEQVRGFGVTGQVRLQF